MCKISKVKKIMCLGLSCAIMFSTPISSMAATEQGTYPVRKGTILVTPDAYKDLIPTGHAAIVYSMGKVVESLSDGVGVHKNNWKTKKNKIYGVTVYGTAASQDATVAEWCKQQVGKKYNFNYFNVETRKKFYCSQLIWAGYKDNHRIDLNTSAFGKAIHPMELVNSSKTYTVYTYTK